MDEQHGFNKTLVGINQEETLANCLQQLDFLQQTGEELHPGYHINFELIRGALGHELAQVASNTPRHNAD